MSGALKSIGTIGGGVLGGIFGGPAGALVGGALGSSLGGVGNVGAPMDANAYAAQRGFSGDILNPSGTSLVGNQIQYADPSIKGRMYSNIFSMDRPIGDMGALRGNLVPLRGDLAQLRADTRPGFGRLSAARVKAIKDAGSESIGNLRESLARRNVLGSSFANDAISRQQMAIGQEVERASAEALVQEFGFELQRMGAELGVNQQDMQIVNQSAQLIAQRASMLANQMDRDLQELAVAGNIRNGVNAAVSAQAMQMAQLQMLQQTTNAGNQASLAGLGLAGTAGLFGSGASAATPANMMFGRGAFGMLGGV